MIHVKTMLGLGDAIAARPTIAELLRRDNLQIETPWPQVFGDLIHDPNFYSFVRPGPLNIKCAQRNVEESKVNWWPDKPGAKKIQLAYHLRPGCKSIPEQIADSAGVLEELNEYTGRWKDFIYGNRFLGGNSGFGSGRLGAFRMPTVRKEYHNVARNPAPGLVARAVEKIGGDWIHLNDLSGDEHFQLLENGFDFERIPEKSVAHAAMGELSVTTCLDVVGHARVVVTPVSWMMWAGLMFQVPTVVVWGGFASPDTILGPALTAGKSPLSIAHPDPICCCFNRNHACKKEIPFYAVDNAAGAVMK